MTIISAIEELINTERHMYQAFQKKDFETAEGYMNDLRIDLNTLCESVGVYRREMESPMWRHFKMSGNVEVG